MIRTLINEKYGIHFSLTSVGRLLAQLGLTCQKPLMRAFQQNPSLVEKWLKEEYPAIRVGRRGSALRSSLLMRPGYDRISIPARLGPREAKHPLLE